jgi:hypothetical protein
LHDVEENSPILVARRNIEKAKLIGARRIIGRRGFDRITCVTKIDEVDTLDDPAVLYVEARNYPGLEHGTIWRRECLDATLVLRHRATTIRINVGEGRWAKDQTTI